MRLQEELDRALHDGRKNREARNMTTRSEVRAARETMSGCCDRYADRMGCDCLEMAENDDPNLLEQCEHGRREKDCRTCQTQKRDPDLCQHGKRLNDCDNCLAELCKPVQKLRGVTGVCRHGVPIHLVCEACQCRNTIDTCAKIEEVVDRVRESPTAITIARRLELMHLAQDLVGWAEKKGVKLHEVPLLRRMADLLLEAE